MAALAAAGGAQAGSSAGTAPRNGPIAFVRSLDTRTVFRTTADGSRPTQLSHGGVDINPVVSPDGKRIVFERREGGQVKLFMVGRSGGAARRLVQPPRGANDFQPSWSPDGKLILFGRSDGQRQALWTVRPDGTGSRRIGAPERDEINGAFSPDGTRIVFQRWETDRWAIYSMAADGSDKQLLVQSAGTERNPAYSPDGAKIVFSSSRTGAAGGGSDVFVADADGGHVVNLTRSRGYDSYPAWSPDGTQIAFTSDREGRTHLFTMAADGSKVRDTGIRAEDVGWGADGTLVYTTYDAENDEIFIGNGSKLRRITREPAWDGAPMVSHSGRRIAFSSHRGDDGTNVWLVPVTGGQARRLTDKGNNYALAWSADDSELYVMSSRDGERRLWAFPTAGGAPRRLAAVVLADGGAVSPDGTQLAFAKPVGRKSQLFVLDLATGKQRRLVADQANDVNPAWSPDGTRLAFGTDLLGETMQIAVVGADGNGLVAIDNNGYDDNYPAWSPDSTRVVFQRALSYDHVVIVSAAAAGGAAAPRLEIVPGSEELDYAPSWARLPG